jgi:hypothetical protein
MVIDNDLWYIVYDFRSEKSKSFDPAKKKHDSQNVRTYSTFKVRLANVTFF